VLFAQGFVGAALYILFFVSILRAFIRDRAPIAIAGSLVILLSLFLMVFYNALPSALVLTMIGIGAMVRERLVPA
jgi:O-antigen ligase